MYRPSCSWVKSEQEAVVLNPSWEREEFKTTSSFCLHISKGSLWEFKITSQRNWTGMSYSLSSSRTISSPSHKVRWLFSFAFAVTVPFVVRQDGFPRVSVIYEPWHVLDDRLWMSKELNLDFHLKFWTKLLLRDERKQSGYCLSG